MSLDELQSDKKDKTQSKVNKEVARKQRHSHMKNILTQKQNAGIPLSDEERARLLLLRDLND